MQIQAKATFSTNPKDVFKSAKKILEKPNRKKAPLKLIMISLEVCDMQ